MIKTDILVISDVHLWSVICNAIILLKVLKEYSYRILIIVGDLFDQGSITNDEQFDAQLEVVRYLYKNRGKIIYIGGNHDPAKEIPNRFLGVKTEKKHELHINVKKICFLHGDQFDKICFIFSEPLIDKIFYIAINLLKRINILGFNVAKWLNDFHSKFSLFIAKKAVKYARKHKIDVIICGHTHQPLHYTFVDKKDGSAVDYYNCGDWVENCSFIIIDERGKIQLHSAS